MGGACCTQQGTQDATEKILDTAQNARNHPMHCRSEVGAGGTPRVLDRGQRVRDALAEAQRKGQGGAESTGSSGGRQGAVSTREGAVIPDSSGYVLSRRGSGPCSGRLATSVLPIEWWASYFSISVLRNVSKQHPYEIPSKHRTTFFLPRSNRPTMMRSHSRRMVVAYHHRKKCLETKSVGKFF